MKHEDIDHTGLPGIGAGGLSTVLLGTDRTNSTTTLADATGLSFAVVSGTTYAYRFLVRYITAAGTTGIKLSMNGPTNDFAPFVVRAHTGATAAILTTRGAFEQEATTTDTTATTLLALIEGLVKPTAGGTLIVRFASEVGGSLVTVQAGSAGILHAL